MNRPIILDISNFGPHFPTPEYCPLCRSPNFVPIMYGLPAKETVARARAGELALGGCRVRDESWRCKRCGHRWPKYELWPTDEEFLAFRLRFERHCKRPDVFLRILAGKLTLWCMEFIERYVSVPLLIHREHGAIHRKIKLKDGGFQYIVRFRNGTVRVRPNSEDISRLEASFLRGPLAGTRESGRYESAALRIVMRQASAG